jgi:hypothetical protein
MVPPTSEALTHLSGQESKPRGHGVKAKLIHQAYERPTS